MSLQDAQAWATIIASFAVIIGVASFWLSARSFRKDAFRFTRESAEFAQRTLSDQNFRDQRLEAIRILEEKEPSDLSDPERIKVQRMLSTYGMLALAANLGSVDDRVLIRFWGSSLKKDWMRVTPYVTFRRAKTNNPNLHIETEILLRRWNRNNWTRKSLFERVRSDVGKAAKR